MAESRCPARKASSVAVRSHICTTSTTPTKASAPSIAVRPRRCSGSTSGSCLQVDAGGDQLVALALEDDARQRARRRTGDDAAVPGREAAVVAWAMHLAPIGAEVDDAGQVRALLSVGHVGVVL